MIRQRAHALTLLALFWTIFSLWAVFGEIDSWNHGNHDLIFVAVTIIILAIHAAIIYFALYLWRTEKPEKIIGEGFLVDDMLDRKPKDINPTKERSRFLRVVILDLLAFFFVISNLALADKGGLLGGGIFFGSIFSLHILLEGIRYIVLKRRFNRGF